MKRSKALAVALFAAVVALVSLTGSAQAATLAVGQKITVGTAIHTITAVDAPKHSAKAKSASGAISCWTDVQPASGALPTGKIGSKKMWKYTCPTSIKLVGGTLSRAW